ncbi:F-box/FBD/LRR-repeat protein At2g04230-like [Rutidosis leptorrhynchoides]|uniref:F-box/FBD/LRR-repeat protein At2g04230-like n=1 Tax=Rutidosis leptorrhynchoides TaxID=125765 RepID=UPI003A9A64B9
MESELPVELIHRIQSCMSEKNAGGTCILSKSWLHAWYTIPHLRFHKDRLIDNTLERYHRLNLPIQTLDIWFEVRKHDTAPLTRWIRQVASTSCLKELSLSFDIIRDSFTLPDSIFSGKNLTGINVINEAHNCSDNIEHRRHGMFSSNNNMINCVSLRVLVLHQVNISEESKFIFLEELNVEFVYRTLNITSFVIASNTLKRLTLYANSNMPNDIQVDALALFYFYYESYNIPTTLSFPVVAPKHIELKINLATVDAGRGS